MEQPLDNQHCGKQAAIKNGSEPNPSVVKRFLFLVCGICWLGFGVGFACLLVQYLTQGGGMQIPGFDHFFGLIVSPGSVTMGMIHVVGLLMLSIGCFGVGINLCLRSRH